MVRRPRNFGECFAFRINERKSRLNRTVYIVLYTVHYIRISFPFCESLICIILLLQTGTIPNFQSREFFNGYDSRKLNPPQPKSRSDYPNFLTIIWKSAQKPSRSRLAQMQQCTTLYIWLVNWFLGQLYICKQSRTLTDASSPAVTGLIYLRRLGLFLGQCGAVGV